MPASFTGLREFTESAARPVGAPRDAFEIRRADIAWSLVPRDSLLITITIRNRSDHPTRAARAQVRSAAFGAFAPQQPLTTLAVPPIAPRGAIELSTVVPLAALARSEALGGEPPRARPIGPAGEDRPRWMSASEVLRSARFIAGARRTRVRALDTSNWAGNLHVFVRATSVERHSAQGLVVRPDVENLISFSLGDGHRDAYRFRLHGQASSWRTSLSDVLSGRVDLPFARGRRSDEGHEWIEFERRGYMLFGVRPPPSAQPGRAELHVQRRSTGRTAVVEFELAPRA